MMIVNGIVGEACMSKTIEMFFSSFPRGSRLVLHYPPKL